MKHCDIIIPIYNAYDCLKPCIDSVLKNTNMDNSRLILINDKSTDNRVLPLLKEYSNNPSIVLLENEENIGFVSSVNKGMQYSSDNDVLLLNSDTEVTKNWLKKIQECAYSRDEIATVTPLSNNATLVSVPKSFVPNNLPDGYDIDSFADVVEKASFKDYPEVPTGHGFCLFIKREALNIVGLFDEETYGKGYGEENDFCFRCLDVGLTNVVCDSAYVYHKESQSFSAEKNKLCKQGLRAIEGKYPIYKNKLDNWILNRSINYLGNNINLELGKNYSNNPNILFIIHDWKNVPDTVSGTTLHAWDIIKKLVKYYNFHILIAEDNIYKIYSYWGNINNKTEIQYNSIDSFTQNNFYNKKYSLMLQEIIERLNINCIHIHHLKGHYFDAIDVSKKNKLKVILTIHDYYLVCPTINKLYLDKQQCDNPSVDKCSVCLNARYTTIDRGLHFIKRWKTICHEELKKCDLLIAPSYAAKNEILKSYDDLKIEIIEHGTDIYNFEKNFNNTKKHFDIAFVGAIGLHKGSNILVNLSKRLHFSKVKLHLFGTLDRVLKQNKHYINHGQYKREELTKLLHENEIDLVCLFSIWSETYSYTLTEAISCGIPVLAFDIGAIAERIKKYNLGYIIPITSDVTTIKKEIIRISKNKQEYLEKIDSIKNYKIKSVDEMDQEYSEIYQKHFTNLDSKPDYIYIKKKIKDLSTKYVNFNIQNYEWILNSLKWRIVSKIKIPQSIAKIYRQIKYKK